MKSLGFKTAAAVGVLPAASAALKGCSLLLTTDNKPYWCNGVAWVCLVDGNASTLGGSARDTAFNSFGSGTVPVRHPAGYLYSNYFSCSADTQTNAPSHVAIQTNSDNFIRWQTNAQFKANLFVDPAFTGHVDVNASGVYLPASTNMAAATGVTGGLKVQSQGSAATAGAAFMSFHRLGAFAAHLGIDTDNQLKIGGWSLGANAYKVWNESNDGPGSGLNADLLDGQEGAYYAPKASPVFTGPASFESNDFRWKPNASGAAGISVIARNDGSNFYLLPTNAGDALGSWNALRPFSFNLSTGAATFANGLAGTLTGNASTASKLAVPRTLSVYVGIPGQPNFNSIGTAFDGTQDILIQLPRMRLCLNSV